MEAEEMLKELADLEIPCEDTDCHNGYIGTRPHVTEPLECPTCKGTGKVPVFPMLRTKCKSFIPPCPHGEDDCPGWREKTLDEARLCLEELLVAYWKMGELGEIDWYDMADAIYAALSANESVTEAAIAALYEASKVKTDA